jgi:hypothetical protein
VKKAFDKIPHLNLGEGFLKREIRLWKIPHPNLGEGF